MNKLTLFVIVALVLQACSSQYIGKSRSATIRSLQPAMKYNHYQGNPIEEGKDFVAMHVNDSNWYRTSFYYDFDKKGTCYRERVITYCDTCFRKYRNKKLDIRKIDWVKVSDSFYVSKFSQQRALELHSDGQQWFIEFKKMNWSQSDYDYLLNQR